MSVTNGPREGWTVVTGVFPMLGVYDRPVGREIMVERVVNERVKGAKEQTLG